MSLHPRRAPLHCPEPHVEELGHLLDPEADPLLDALELPLLVHRVLAEAAEQSREELDQGGVQSLDPQLEDVGAVMGNTACQPGKRSYFRPIENKTNKNVLESQLWHKELGLGSRGK